MAGATHVLRIPLFDHAVSFIVSCEKPCPWLFFNRGWR